MLKNNCATSEIVGIQFGLMSPEEIRRSSVVEITSREMYTDNVPVMGGLVDARMGVLEHGLICPTDGLDYVECPGYFGSLELAVPLFYIQYLMTIQKIAKCICYKCSKLLINKEKYKHALNMDEGARWKYVYDLVDKYVKPSRCGDDNEDGCQCLQPNKIRKEGLSTIYFEWSADDTHMETLMTAEMFLKMFKRISDEDITFMGFSPIWSRPEWMICQVMLVPPPAVRPSVKYDAQQRSEDDLTHSLINIVKTNADLKKKIDSNAAPKVISELTSVLQLYFTSQVDNQVPGTNPVSQRSGRPFKSIKERLNGKGGRVRGNLMGKRVDYSARSVITADPNISIKSLGVPLKIAKNITKPVVVNAKNRSFLSKLARNGPTYPGANIWEKKSGDLIPLKYFDRKNIILEDGDIIHRHMVDGDPIIFNRQPTLHRMSMMCHIAKIMYRGDTFRMNVADTKPYNADFDGDEMNLHMPQNAESDSELKNLAAVPYQIISPGSNAPIIGIYQDSMLGSFRFTRENISFSPHDAMNLLMMFNKIDVEALNKAISPKSDRISSFDILSQIMPPMSVRIKNKKFSDSDNVATTNNILEIRAGKYIRGQLDKGTLGAGSKGIIHRICNDFGNMAAADFIDNLQNVITEYMKASAFSVGINDLIITEATDKKIVEIITDKKADVKNIIDQVQTGVFDNTSGKSNKDEFEVQVMNILGKAQSEAGRAALKNLHADNRFAIMFNAGSKGSEINIQQMTSCLGQQNVDNKRIPYGFDFRTLPHYTKYDDSAVARGFVESSYINGLTPQELYFHAMGGRIGLIDTAVKTSSTGYIQRKLIKGLEDLMINYDMTIRTNKNIIVQFTYGNDSIDTTKVENQELPLSKMNIESIYEHFSIPQSKASTKLLNTVFTKSAITRARKQKDQLKEKCEHYTNYLIDIRKSVITNIFANKSETGVKAPVAFHYIIENLAGQLNINSNSMVDFTMLEAFQMIEEAYSKLESIQSIAPSELFKVLYTYYLSPRILLVNRRFNRRALELLLETITLSYKRAIVAPGEMVGIIAGQSIGEPTTQMTLNTFHFAGVASKSNVTRGVPRIEEILALSENLKNPSLTIYLNKEDETSKERAITTTYMIEHTTLRQLVKSVDICFDPDVHETNIAEDNTTMLQYNEFEKMVEDCGATATSMANKSKWIIRLEMDPRAMLDKNITMDDVNFMLRNAHKDDIECVFSDYNADKLVFRVRMVNLTKKSTQSKNVNSLDQSDQIYVLNNFQEQLLNNIVLRGIKNIKHVQIRTIKDYLVDRAGTYEPQDIWVLDTIGTNLIDVLALDYIDATRTTSNNIIETYHVLGIEAARQTIYNELADVIEYDGTYLNYHHMELLCDRMSFNEKLVSIGRFGINNDNIGPIAKASFEETPEMFLKAARHGELDSMRGVSANIMCGQEGKYGTNSFNVLMDISEMNNIEGVMPEATDIDAAVDAALFEGLQNEHDSSECALDNLRMDNRVENVKPIDLGGDNDYNPFSS